MSLEIITTLINANNNLNLNVHIFKLQPAVHSAYI